MMILRSLILVTALFLVTVWAQSKKCDDQICKPPGCYCRSSKMPIKGKDIANETDIPQFVMLTFDDAISDSNIEFYRLLLTLSRTNPAPTNCPIRATFFIAHEYTNYAYVNELYGKGHEIASHSITHTALTDEWRTKNVSSWKTEMDGLRKIAEKFGLIPKGKILGTRAPFLQTSGDPLFQMLKENNFLYDSSMPSRKYTHPPMWPYTLDYGFDQDCIVEPCPTGKFPGVWEVPLVMLWREREVIPGVKEEYPCSMADACVPLPLTAKDTRDFLYDNFERHYKDNRAPFPVFIHESWLKDPERKQGYLNFVEDVRKHQNVYFVTVQEVIEYMKNPIPLKDYKNKACRKNSGGDGCKRRACNFQVGPEAWDTRRMDICISPCPDENEYPWINRIPS